MHIKVLRLIFNLIIWLYKKSTSKTNETNKILMKVIFLMKLGEPFGKHCWNPFTHDYIIRFNDFNQELYCKIIKNVCTLIKGIVPPTMGRLFFLFFFLFILHSKLFMTEFTFFKRTFKFINFNLRSGYPEYTLMMHSCKKKKLIKINLLFTIHHFLK